MDNLNRLNNLKIVHNMKSVLQNNGKIKSNIKGQSLDFSDYSQYEIGDDFRKIDWNIYGRTRKLYVKNYEAERQIVVNIFLDISKSMEDLKTEKFNKAFEIAKNLSYIALNNNNKVVWHRVDNSGKLYAYNIKTKQMLSSLRAENLKPLVREKYMSKVLNAKIGIHQTSILISDCYSFDMEEVIKLFAYRKNNLIVLQTLAEEEKKIDLNGDIILKDVETDSEIKIEITRKIREKYQLNLKKHQYEIEKKAMKYGYRFVNVNLEQKVSKILFKDLIKERILR